MKASIIRDVLFENGFVLKDVAKSMGISPQHLNNVFSVKDVKIGTLLKFVEVTDIPLVDFLIKCDHINKVDKQFKHHYKQIKEIMKNQQPKEFYNPTTEKFSKEQTDGFYPLIMWKDGKHSELLYQKGNSVCYGTLTCYRLNENTAMALSTSVLEYVDRETFNRYKSRF